MGGPEQHRCCAVHFYEWNIKMLVRRRKILLTTLVSYLICHSIVADSSNSTSNVTTSSSIAKSIEAKVARISVITTTEAKTYETTVPTTSTEPITTTKTIVPTSYRKVTSIKAKKATTIKPREESKVTEATTLKLKEETTSRPISYAITKGTAAKAVKVTIITSENNSDAEKACEVIEVTNGTSSSTGNYFLSHERAAAAPNLHVWKLEGKDRYIFNTGTDNGWRIGRYMFLSTGRSYYKSSITKLPKLQAAEWKSSNGLSVQVKCLEYPELIVVSGSDLAKCTGTYHKCGEKSVYAKKRPVYQLQGEDRYIYYYPNSKGWRIGSKNSLAAGENAGDYYYASGMDTTNPAMTKTDWMFRNSTSEMVRVTTMAMEEYSQTTTSLPSTTTKVSQLARQPKVLADKPSTPSSGLVLSLPQQSQTNIPEDSGSASNIVKIDPITLSSILIFFVFLLL